MKKLLFGVLAVIFSLGLHAQTNEEQPEPEKKGYQFTMEKQIPVTSVKDQYRSGTCWSFSGLGFVEAEMLRQGKPEYDLSEAFIFRKCYEDKIVKYVRMHGSINFAGGGSFGDVFNTIDKYGIVPENVYDGLTYGDTSHVHGELDAILKAYAETIIKNPNKKLSTAWFSAYQSLLDGYLGEVPETFTYNGVEYTPASFGKSLGFNTADYVNLTSYTHHPFYEPFILEIPDNWAWGSSYNVPIDELIDIMNNAINNGYTVCWGADVSEKGFKWSKGVAVVPEEDRPDLDGLERDKWEKLSAREKNEMLYNMDNPVPEKEITQEMRQIAFDNYQTTDDHGMLICGLAKDQNGNPFYYVKNSWNTTDHIYDGFFYASESFVKYKTMNIVVHKDAIPKDIKKKLGIK
ncbi:MAG: C1 family peptidase [Bacteroidales bacterium]|jgi:bleomycin hydrolase|nr:C1 family peptidase [Bacteroidales bacterium]